MRIVCGRWWWLLLLLACCGCARNALLREEARDFAAGAGAAANAGRAFYDSAIATDRDLRATLLAIDSDCVPAELRTAAGDPPECEIAGEVVPLRGTLSRESFAAEYAQLDFLASYLGALAKLTADIESHSGANFKAAKADLDTLLKAFGDDGVGLSDDATGAVAELLDLLNTLSKEKASADEIRALLRDKGERAHAALLALAEALLADADLRKQGEAVTQTVHLVALRNGLLGEAGTRTQALHSYYARDDRRHVAETLDTRCRAQAADDDARRYCGAPAAGLMAAAARTHHELLELSRGNLNPRQKARAARIAYGRFMQAAKLFVKFATVF